MPRATHPAGPPKSASSRFRGAPYESSFDLLVDFDECASLLDQIAFEQDVSDLLGVAVDVVSSRALSAYLRDDVMREAVEV